jgi:hypothetical protein
MRPRRARGRPTAPRQFARAAPRDLRVHPLPAGEHLLLWRGPGDVAGTATAGAYDERRADGRSRAALHR